MLIHEEISKLLDQKKHDYEAKKDYPKIWDEKLDTLFNKIKSWLNTYEKEGYLTVTQASDYYNQGYYKKNNLVFDSSALDHGTINPKTIIIKFFNDEDIVLEPIGTDIVNGFGRVDINAGADKWFLVAKEKDRDDWLLVNPYNQEEFHFDMETFLEKIILDFISSF